MTVLLPIEDRRAAFRADCGNCFALCCSALGFARSADFAIDKPTGDPCVNLHDEDFGCGIHARLRPSGFAGCTVFDCGGAGQRVAQDLFGGVSWREAPESRQLMFAVFPIVRQLQELLWYLSEARELSSAHTGSIDALAREIEGMLASSPEEVAEVDPVEPQGRVSVLLSAVSERVRADARRSVGLAAPSRRFRRGADLIGASLTGRDLRTADLRGAQLIAADLRQADLGWCDLIGADLRDADIRGADLSLALFLTQSQLNATRGDAATGAPAGLLRPTHWAS